MLTVSLRAPTREILSLRQSTAATPQAEISTSQATSI